MVKEISFTKRCFEQLEPFEKRYIIQDANHRDSVKGLVLEIMPSGSKFFRFRRKRLGRDVSVTFGEFPNLTIENARKLAKQTAVELSKGVNPNEAKREQKREAELERELS
ncbi:Arm DNA-binding domain-containing protein [Shewanella youngdeokensis]|uniref:Arm DNA-binding domain-containing protein n=1 Tax=Shewanella youngdeokensis TaxID=2999068 RepID=A0ABZ0K153_9GAMM|nr:Arm DNA-binding domain-containing protein [Shewanella sp. DAU334]